MADNFYKQMITTFIRQTRPQSFRNGKPPRYPQRSLSTGVTAPLSGNVEKPTVARWQQHDLDVPSTLPESARIAALRNESEPRPFSSFLTDNYARQHNYLRISVTERCNLRCVYCMPEEGIELSPPEQNLTTPEIVYLSELFVKQGVNKIRLTGGEPTVRKDIVSLMQQIGQLRSLGLKELCLTTNGISLHRKLDSMVESGLTGVNLSLDTLDPFQFTIMTRRNGFDAVMKSIGRILEMNKLGAGIKLKINCVVMRGLNEREIIPFVEMGKEKDIEVRFIEYMPFDGNKWSENKMLSFKEMLALIRAKYPDVRRVQDHANDTSKTYKIPGFVGRIGFITSMTHNFCGTCNRLRITSDGNLKVCLFGNSEVSLRDILRESNQGKPFDAEAMEAVKQIESNRREALVGSTGALGTSERETQLLDIIGMAVKRKKEKHAGIGELENMKNRPMILIGGLIRYYIGPAKVRRYPFQKPDHPRRIKSTRTRLEVASISQSLSNSRRAFNNYPTPRSPDWTKLSVEELRAYKDAHQPFTHLDEKGAAHMVEISGKLVTKRVATAVSTLLFSDPKTYAALSSQQVVKGDAIAVARVAAIQAAKKTADMVPLAHPGLGITAVSVDIATFGPQDKLYDIRCIQNGGTISHTKTACGGVTITATVKCEGKTGVEMEAITAATIGAVTMYDMLKAIDKGMMITGTRVTRKEGGKSGDWMWHETQNKLVKIRAPKSTPSEQTQKQSEESLHQGTSKVNPSDGSSTTTEATQKPISDIDEWNKGLTEEFMVPDNSTTGQEFRSSLQEAKVTTEPLDRPYFYKRFSYNSSPVSAPTTTATATATRSHQTTDREPDAVATEARPNSLLPSPDTTNTDIDSNSNSNTSTIPTLLSTIRTLEARLRNLQESSALKAQRDSSLNARREWTPETMSPITQDDITGSQLRVTSEHMESARRRRYIEGGGGGSGWLGVSE